MSDEEKQVFNNEEIIKNAPQNGERPLKRKKKKRRKKKKKNFLGLFIVLVFFIAIIGGIGFVINMLMNKPVLDQEYKQALLVGIGQPNGDIKKLSSIVGEEEFKLIVEKYNNDYKAYQVDEKEKGDKKLVENLTHRINLNTHTNMSVGAITTEELLTQAASYADKVKAKYPKEQYPYVIALNDYHQIEQNKIAIKTIYANPEKYKNLKVVLGMEFWSTLKTDMIPTIQRDNHIQLLAYAINPYDKAFDNFNYSGYNFVESIDFIQAQKYGYIGIAHPTMFFDWNSLKEGNLFINWIEDVAKLYNSKKKGKLMFMEAYYQPARFTHEKDWTPDVIKTCDKNGIIKIGGLDITSKNIFEY